MNTGDKKYLLECYLDSLDYHFKEIEGKIILLKKIIEKVKEKECFPSDQQFITYMETTMGVYIEYKDRDSIYCWIWKKYLTV